MPYIEGIRSPLFDIPVECTKWLRGHTHARDSSRVSCQWVIWRSFTISHLYVHCSYLNSQRTSKSFRSAKVLAVYFIFWPGWLAVLWRYYGITSEKRWTWVKKQFMEVKSQGSDLEKLWYLCPDPFPPSGISGLSNWFRSANEARLETVVLKMKHWYCSYQDYTDYIMYRLDWWETVPSNTRYQSKTQKSPFHEPT